MPLTKTYQKYERSGVFGIICNDDCPISYVKLKNKKEYAIACGQASSLAFWNAKTSTITAEYSSVDQREPVTAFDVHEAVVAVGYSDGFVNVFDRVTFEIDAQFRSGKTRVTGLLLAEDVLFCSSGSEVNVLDLVSNNGYKLNGHAGHISRMRHLPERDLLITSGQDCLVKFWHLPSKHCFHTLTGHTSQIWDFALSADATFLVSGSAEMELRCWSVEWGEAEGLLPAVRTEFLGTVARASKKRVKKLQFDSTGHFLVCQTFERALEVFKLLDREALRSRLNKKRKKAAALAPPDGQAESAADGVQLTLADRIRLAYTLQLPAIPCDFDLLTLPRGARGAQHLVDLRFAFNCKNNTLQEFTLGGLQASGSLVKSVTLAVSSREGEAGLVAGSSVARAGHRTVPFWAQLTEEADGLLTVSATEAKVWSCEERRCLLTLEWAAYGEGRLRATAALLAPGNRHAVVAFADRSLRVFDFRSRAQEHVEAEAQAGQIRSLAGTGDARGLVAGCSGRQLTQWRFEVAGPARPGSATLALGLRRHGEPLDLPDQVAAVCCTPDGRLVCAALANLHVDVHFRDSLKRAHSLYGHVAPVTALEASADSRRLLTASLDKSVRLWELQFGNCLRRFTGHEAPVTALAFLPHTALAFSADDAGRLIQWDTRRLRQVATLHGPAGAVRGLAAACRNSAQLRRRAKQPKRKPRNKPVAPARPPDSDDSDHEQQQQESDSDEEEEELTGGVLAAVSQDWSVRLWRESEQLLIVEEEEQLARERAEDDRELLAAEPVVPGCAPAALCEATLLGKATEKTLDGADLLMEALDICEEFETGKKGPPHPLMVVRGAPEDADRFLLNSLRLLRRPSARLLAGAGPGLEHALAALHADHACRLIPRLLGWLDRGLEVELAARALRFLLDLHHARVLQDPQLQKLFDRSRGPLARGLVSAKRMIGVNLAAMEFCRRRIEDSQEVVLFDQLHKEVDAHKKKRRKRKAALVCA